MTKLTTIAAFAAFFATLCAQAQTRTFTLGQLSFDMIKVDGGTFNMGSDDYDDTTPVHSVTLSDYYIAQYELTTQLYMAVTSAYPYDLQDKMLDYYEGTLSADDVARVEAMIGVSDRAMYYMTHDDAVEFVSLLNKNEEIVAQLSDGESFALPTEAQWEYAARGGAKSEGYTYAGSNDVGEVAWYAGNLSNSDDYVYEVNRVGLLKPNELGLYDMCGNEEEWCADVYDNYPSEAQVDPLCTTSMYANSIYYVLRGGSYANSYASQLTVSHRTRNPASMRLRYYGMRLVLNVPKSAATATSAVTSSAVVVATEWYDISGRRLAEPASGICIRRDILSDGTARQSKVLVKCYNSLSH